MLMRKHYQRDDDGELKSPPVVEKVEIQHTGVSPKQCFSMRRVRQGQSEGWLEVDEKNGEILLNTDPEVLHYAIIRGPGRWCCHCGEKLLDDMTGVKAREHITEKHVGEVSPSADNPTGYRHNDGYYCMLDAKQHKKWIRPANATVSHFRG